ncbi:MAG: HDOD domain-containing protein [Bdellovibrionales bacterium]|nr:HDOD domain-containing protein [Massilia sp.]
MDQPDHDIRSRLLIARLPAMPQILIKLIEHLQADDLGMPELAALVATDAGMSAKLLCVANSSAYHRSGRSIGLEQSLVALGTDMIKMLVIGESVFQTFNNFPHSGSTDLRSFWKHSLSAAVIARDLARRIDYPHVEEAYLAGLLHNVGRLALLATAPQEYAFNFTARDDEQLCAVEQRTLQITHAEAGAWLIERWKLDSFLADAVLYHHEPSNRLEASHPLIRIVRVAHLLSSHAADDEAVLAAMGLCGLDGVALDEILAASGRQVASSAAALEIDLTGADDIPTPSAFAPAAMDPVQQRLAEEVRNLVLVSEVGQAFARQQREAGLLESMTRSARILFDFDNTVILLENPTGHTLIGAPSGEQQRMAEFTVPLDRGGPIADSASGRRLTVISRDAPELGVPEQQLLRMLGTESMVCLPLVAGARCLGVLVGGVAAWQLPSCQKREKFMQSFGVQAANALESAMSERGHARRQLIHAAEEFREASRRVVHEVNNPLSIIKNYLSVLDDKLARSEPVVGEMTILNEEIDRVGQLISGLAEMPQAPPQTAAGANAARVVDDVLRLFRATAFVPASVELVADVHHEPSQFEGDAETLKQILVNLVKNAVEALGGGGRIEIVNRGHVNRERKMYVELVVSDNGPGLSAEVMANLFSPLRQSKAAPNRGLGLSIVHSLVKKMDGLISCRSGRAGTSFEILLPAPVAADGAAVAQARQIGPV